MTIGVIELNGTMATINSENINPEEEPIPQHLIDQHELVLAVKEQEVTQEAFNQRFYDRCIMVFNVPKVGPDRLPKLRNVLEPLFSLNKNFKYKENHPLDEENKTKGYCFVEYESKEAASAGLIACDGHRLDKNHLFAAYPFTSINNIEEPDQDWKEPARRHFSDNHPLDEKGNLRDLWWWLQHPKCIDQFAIQVDSQMKSGGQGGGMIPAFLSVFSYARNNEPLSVESRNSWTESLFKWSPYGTYLTTMHVQGVILWAGEKFDRFRRLEHNGVNYIDFSPHETYLVTYRREERRAGGDAENCLRVFEVFTGEMKKAFSPTGAFRIPDWPFLKWSYDEKFFAFCRPKGNAINLFGTEKFTLHENRSIELDGLVRFEFNPTKPVIAYYCEERLSANQPAEIGLLDYQTREKVRAQRTFNVSEANLYWQRVGQYLAAHTERYKSRKVEKDDYGLPQVKLSNVTSHLDIFDYTTGKDVSVQTLQLAEPLVSFGWEPKGPKFCVLMGSGTKILPLVYRIDPGKPTPQLMSKLEPGMQLNTIEWAPQGGWLVAYAANAPSGSIQFLDTNGAEATRFRSLEHPYINQGSWDPTGRYFVTCTFARNRYESGYTVHTFQGRQLYRKQQDALLRFKWRPRPPVNLPEQKIREIKKSLKQLSAKFDEEDRRELTQLSNEQMEARKMKNDAFARFREETRRMLRQDRQLRLELRGGYDADSGDDLVEVSETIPLDTRIEKLEEENGEKPQPAIVL